MRRRCRKLPAEHKFGIAMFVYVTICFLEGGVLYMPVDESYYLKFYIFQVIEEL